MSRHSRFSPWFEARRSDYYYARLLAVSTDGDWDGFIHFTPLAPRGRHRHTPSMLKLVAVQNELKDTAPGRRRFTSR